MTFLWVIIIFLLIVGGGVWAWPLLAGALGFSSVTDKPGAIKNIAQLMRTYNISIAEIEVARNQLDSYSASAGPNKTDLGKTLFIYLGAIFILAGVSTYIAMFWDSMSSFMRISVTLGIGYVLLIVLVSALHENKFPKLILPLSLASVFMMTSGWFVFVDELFSSSGNWRLATLFVFGMMAIHQGILLAKYQRTVMALTSLFFTYGFMQVGLDMLGLPMSYIAIVLGASVFLVGCALDRTNHRVLVEPTLLVGICWLNGGLFDQIALMTSPNWASVVTGFCLMLTAYGLQKEGRYIRLVGLGYFVGSIMTYSGLFDLLQDTSIELAYFAITASALYACLVLQSRALLLTTVLAMLSYIGYFSAEYFADSLGWPITLVLMGIAFLGVGTLAVKLKQKI